MPLDIQAFRSIAAQNPDKLVFVQGESLKTASRAAQGTPEAFKAATEAFIRAYGEHYGAKLGNMSRQSLQEYADGSKPLTASVVSQMLAYADGKAGDKRMVQVGDAKIDIAKVGTEKIPFQGFTTATRAQRAEAGRKAALEGVLAAFECKDGGKVDAAGLLKQLNTLGAFFGKEFALLGMAADADKGDWKDFVLKAAVEGLDNRKLSAVYQGIASRETDTLKNELARLMAHPDVALATQQLAERAFTDICRLEAFVLQEVSARIQAGDDARRGGSAGDVTVTNLALLVGASAKGAIAAEESAKNVRKKGPGPNAG